MSAFQNAVDSLSSAISGAEGFGVQGAIPTNANNPGDLAEGDLGNGTLGSAGITVFPTLEAGEAALKSQVTKMLSGTSSVYNPNMTIAQAGNIYSGSSSGNWASIVAAALGVSPNSTLGSLLSGNAPSQSADNSVSSTVGAATTGAVSSVETATSGWLSRGVFIVLGMILIAAGIFQFKPVQDTVVEFGKGAVEGAKAAALA